MSIKSVLKYLPSWVYFAIRRLANRYMSYRVFNYFFDWHPSDIPGIMFHYDARDPDNVYLDIYPRHSRGDDPVGLIKGASHEFDFVQRDASKRPAR